MAFRKDFGYTREINQQLRRINEFGIFNRIMERDMKSFFQCPTAQGGDQLGFEKMITVFVFILVASIASVLILCLEFFTMKLK